ncbi:hypothetical protein IF2G_10438 [Cordyceps javanica]|nr:hypothetical protein IF2G_10438 [Cordyceps javanica]
MRTPSTHQLLVTSSYYYEWHRLPLTKPGSPRGGGGGEDGEGKQRGGLHAAEKCELLLAAYSLLSMNLFIFVFLFLPLHANFLPEAFAIAPSSFFFLLFSSPPFFLAYTVENAVPTMGRFTDFVDREREARLVFD